MLESSKPATSLEDFLVVVIVIVVRDICLNFDIDSTGFGQEGSKAGKRVSIDQMLVEVGGIAVIQMVTSGRRVLNKRLNSIAAWN